MSAVPETVTAPMDHMSDPPTGTMVFAPPTDAIMPPAGAAADFPVLGMDMGPEAGQVDGTGAVVTANVHSAQGMLGGQPMSLGELQSQFTIPPVQMPDGSDLVAGAPAGGMDSMMIPVMTGMGGGAQYGIISGNVGVDMSQAAAVGGFQPTVPGSFQPAPIPGVIPDSELKPAQLSMEDLQRELTARGIVYSNNDKVVNVGKLVAYLIDQKHGESDLSSESSEDETLAERDEQTFSFLEVLLVSYGQQKKPLMDWLRNWQRTAEEMNRVEITELKESSLIKIRVWNNTSEPSGLIEQLNSVNIKCARYYCYTRGLVWGGWEFYEHGQLQKQEGYNNDNQPPLFWKRLCWVENAEIDLSVFDKYNSVLPFPSQQISRMFGTDEEMVCSGCGNVEDVCLKVHGNFKGYFESKDLFERHMSIVQ
eukprot:221397_1